MLRMGLADGGLEGMGGLEDGKINLQFSVKELFSRLQFLSLSAPQRQG